MKMSSENNQSRILNVRHNLLVGAVVPSLLVILHLQDTISFRVLIFLIVLFVIVFIILPLTYKNSYTLQRYIIFSYYVSWPLHHNFKDPTEVGVSNCRNFYVKTDEGVSLGAWQILTEGYFVSKNELPTYNFEEALNDGQNVILYSHGNCGTRAEAHQIELYKVLRTHFHVIVFDYRGYADSTRTNPTEDGLSKDITAMYNWIAQRTNSKIFLWGSSLGTSLSLKALASLEEENRRPYGVILESPFTNLRDEIIEHPIAKLFKKLPWFYYTIVNPMQNNFKFQSDLFILSVNCPILILHAEDDLIVPYKLGKRLYEIGVSNRNLSQGFIKFEGFARSLGYGHKYICRAPVLHYIIEKFVHDAIIENAVKKLN